MKHVDKLIEDFISEALGKDIVSLVKVMGRKKDVSEFKLADKLRITVNKVRSMLYRLNSKNLVSFTRKKDKRKGWYIYYWTFDGKRAGTLALDYKRDKLKQLKQRLEKEKSGSFFVCPGECIKVDQEGAMEHYFSCPECGQILVQEDGAKIMRMTKREISKSGKELENVEEQLEKKQKRMLAAKKPKKKGSEKKVKAKKRAVKKPKRRKPKKTKKRKKA